MNTRHARTAAEGVLADSVNAATDAFVRSATRAATCGEATNARLTWSREAFSADDDIAVVGVLAEVAAAAAAAAAAAVVVDVACFAVFVWAGVAAAAAAGVGGVKYCP